MIANDAQPCPARDQNLPGSPPSYFYSVNGLARGYKLGLLEVWPVCILHCLPLLISRSPPPPPPPPPSLQEATSAVSDAEVGDGGRKTDQEGEDWVNSVIGSLYFVMEQQGMYELQWLYLHSPSVF